MKGGDAVKLLIIPRCVARKGPDEDKEGGNEVGVLEVGPTERRLPWS